MIKVFHDFSPKPSACGEDTTLTLGTFDGVHRGHCRILERVREHAVRTGTAGAVVTFDRHPMTVVRPGSAPQILTTLEEKVALFAENGIDTVHVVTFTADVAEMTAERFVEERLLGCLSMRHMIVGYDHHFGKGRSGTQTSLEDIARRHGFTVAVQEPMKYNGRIVKSTAIRESLQNGDVRGAAEMLGRVYTVSGHVAHGTGTGTRLGFPTANVTVADATKLIPKDGVYAGWISFGQYRFDAVMNIGGRPTFNVHGGDVIEVHIPGYTGDMYDADVRVGFSGRIRDISTFQTEQDLVQRISEDVETVKRMQSTSSTY